MGLLRGAKTAATVPSETGGQVTADGYFRSDRDDGCGKKGTRIYV